MNPLPPNADELVSAYLDGEAAPAEITIVESSPELMMRVDELRAISAQLGAAPAAPLAQKETHIAAALDAFDALFATSDTATSDTAPSDTSDEKPRLAAVPPAAAPVSAPAETTSVRSLDAARERRRPRRFNTGVIAAAAAVMLLFVAAAALSFGRGNSSDDVATASDSITAAEVTSADSAGSSAINEADAAEEPSALREIAPPSSPLPQPTAAPEAAAAQSAEAMADEAMDDEDSAAMDDAVEETMEEPEAEEAMADEAMDDEAIYDENFAGDADEDAQDDGSTGLSRGEDPLYFLGEFDSRAQLKAGLEVDGLEGLDISIEELLEGVVAFESGFIPSCRDELPELIDTEADQVLAEASIKNEGTVITEVYVLTNADLTRDLYVLDRDDCALIAVLLNQ